jgi:hypothetical protein
MWADYTLEESAVAVMASRPMLLVPNYQLFLFTKQTEWL